MVKKLVITAGYSGYGDPYAAALGDDYDYASVESPRAVESVDWSNVAAVVFSGGADIDPAFYNEDDNGVCHTSASHDALDRAVLDAIADYPSIKKMGTCRGAQLLWAVNGGKLHQHIPNHHGDHVSTIVRLNRSAILEMRKPCMTYPLPTTFHINSIHHQAVDWESWYPVAHYEGRPPIALQVGEAHEQTAIEAWAMPDAQCLGFQWHPEWMDPDSDAIGWFNNVVRCFVNGWSGGAVYVDADGEKDDRIPTDMTGLLQDDYSMGSYEDYDDDDDSYEE